MLKPNTRLVFDYLKKVNGQNVTAADVADAIGMGKKSVDSIFTFGLQCKGYGVRTEAEVVNPDGTTAKVKYLSLTADGLALDPDAE